MEILHIPLKPGVSRPDFPNYFLDIAETVASRSTCPRLRVGCVLTQGNRIVATGYNGASAGQDHCIDVGCLLGYGHCLRSTHAEWNALLFLGAHTKFLSAYVTHRPCPDCEYKLEQNNIGKVYYRHEYLVHL